MLLKIYLKIFEKYSIELFYIFRFPVGKGIAGHVAETGVAVNVTDVYNDPRFNAEVDEEVGARGHV